MILDPQAARAHRGDDARRDHAGNLGIRSSRGPHPRFHGRHRDEGERCQRILGPVRRRDQGAFRSFATNLDSRAADGFAEIYVKDLVSGHVTLASTDDGGIAAANNDSFDPFLSADGTKVAFWSAATELGPANTNPIDNVYVKDLTTGDSRSHPPTARACMGTAAASSRPSPPTGTWCPSAPSPSSWQVTPNSLSDIYVKNLTTGHVTLVSADGSGRRRMATATTGTCPPTDPCVLRVRGHEPRHRRHRLHRRHLREGPHDREHHAGIDH